MNAMFRIYCLYEYGISLNLIKTLVQEEISLSDFLNETDKSRYVQNKKPKLFDDIMKVLPTIDMEKAKISVAQLAHEGLSKTIIDHLLRLNLELPDIENLTLDEFNEMSGTKKNSVFQKMKEAYAALENKRLNPPRNLIEAYVMDIIDSLAPEEAISLLEIKQHLPFPLENDILTEIIQELKEKNKVSDSENEKVKRYLPKLDDYLKEEFPDKEIFLSFLDGHSVVELAHTHQYSRQGMYNILKRTVDRMPRFEEYYKYSGLFGKYNIDESLFCALFNEKKHIYIFLEFVLTKGEKSPLEDIYNSRFTEAQKKIILHYYNRYMNKDGEIKEISKINIFDEVVEHYANDPVTDKDLVDKYNEYITKQNFPPSLMSDESSLRGLSDRSKKVIRGNSHTYRYYNYDLITNEVIHSLSSLLQLEPGVYSMKKIFKENPDLMEEIDIQSEHELHFLYRQMVPLQHVKYTRMPEFEVGNITKNSFLLRLFHEYSPILLDEFLQFLDETYGIRADSTRSHILSNLHEYIDGDYIKTEYASLPSEDLEELSKLLNQPLYTVEEILEIGRKVNANFGEHFINNMTLSKLGYTLKSSYALRNDYSSLDQYYRTLLLSKDYFYNDHLPIYSTQSFAVVLYELEKNYELFKIENDVYMTYSKFMQSGMSKSDIMDFKEAVLSFTEKNEYYTLYSIRQNGFQHALENLGFTDLFYERLIWTFEEVRSIQTASGYIFKRTDTVFSLSDFLYDLILAYRIIDIYDLLDEIKSKYGISLEKSKVLYRLKDTDIFYSEELYKLYADKEDYYEEVYES